ncbi:Ras-related protein rab7 [Larimichthys crocea]|uniref:Uncharacterized protein n=1 Tax=Larimichthys crocea TaxID=215358 RepID=A0ACD3RH42_LARCR|nr:Ras-related protein rab7 [Larimichthys crocea]
MSKVLLITLIKNRPGTRQFTERQNHEEHLKASQRLQLRCRQTVREHEGREKSRYTENNPHRKLRIWDTAGTERFQSLGTPLYRGAHCCMLVFDVTSRASFSALDGWRKEFLIQGEPQDPSDFPFIVLGNKTDLSDREVSGRQALQWCEEIGAEYFEGSAKEDRDVEKPFLRAAECGLQQVIH